MKRVSIADDSSRLASIDLNYWFYGRSALPLFPTWRTCAACSMRTTTFSSMPCTLDARTSSTESWQMRAENRPRVTWARPHSTTTRPSWAAMTRPATQSIRARDTPRRQQGAGGLADGRMRLGTAPNSAPDGCAGVFPALLPGMSAPPQRCRLGVGGVMARSKNRPTPH